MTTPISTAARFRLLRLGTSKVYRFFGLDARS
jgi:hypothetical protein